MGALLGVVHPLELAQDRAGAPHRHAQVVEELGVEVGDRARDVGLGDRGELGEHVGGGRIGARAGGERDLRLRRHPAEAPAGRDDRLVEHRVLRGLEPEPLAQHPQRPLEVAVVAEHRLDRQPRRQRDVLRAGDRLAPLDHEPHHRLAVAVDHRQGQHAAAQAHHRQQRAHLEHLREPPPHRAVGQLARQVSLRRRHLDLAPRRAGLVDREHPAAAPRRAFGSQPGGAQAAVEAVEHEPILGARAAGLEREALGEQRDRGVPVELRRQQQLDRRGRHAA